MGIPRWGLESLRPYWLSMLTWVRSRLSWLPVGRPRQRARGCCVGQWSTTFGASRCHWQYGGIRVRRRELEVKGSGEAEESGEWVEEQME